MSGWLLSALFIAFFATAGAAQAGVAVTFRTVDRGVDSKIDTYQGLVARTTETWHLIWYKHQGTAGPPQIDFRHEMVVAVFAGRRPTSEYALEIVSVIREEESLVVRYRMRVDATKAMPPLATAPFHIIAVPAEHAPIKLIELPDKTPPAITTRSARRH